MHIMFKCFYKSKNVTVYFIKRRKLIVNKKTMRIIFEKRGKDSKTLK